MEFFFYISLNYVNYVDEECCQEQYHGKTTS